MNRHKILVVEDNRDHLMALAIQLKAHGYTVVGAQDGISATSMVIKEQPDLVLLDLGLPAGDGFVVMERMRNSIPTATIPIIVITARDPQGNKERASKAGATTFLQKPVDSNLLLAVIRKALGENSLAHLTQN